MSEGQTGNVIGNVADGADGVFNFKTKEGERITEVPSAVAYGAWRAGRPFLTPRS